MLESVKWRLRIPRAYLQDHPLPVLWRPKDNGGKWWLATSEKTVQGLLRLFKSGDAAQVLYSIVGQVEPTAAKYEGRSVVLIQLRDMEPKDQWMVDVSLTDLGVGLLDLVENPDSIVIAFDP